MLGRWFHGGHELSLGQWQRVALARAFMRDAEILVLDEPTASLDAQTEYEIFQHFKELTDGKMAILISHRFSTVRMADRIVVIERGRVAENRQPRRAAAPGRYLCSAIQHAGRRLPLNEFRKWNCCSRQLRGGRFFARTMFARNLR